MSWGSFFAAAEADPVEFLSLQILDGFGRDGGALRPGELLSVFPPFVSAASENGVSMRAIPALDRIRFLGALAAQISGVEDGTRVQFLIK